MIRSKWNLSPLFKVSVEDKAIKAAWYAGKAAKRTRIENTILRMQCGAIDKWAEA